MKILKSPVEIWNQIVSIGEIDEKQTALLLFEAFNTVSSWHTKDLTTESALRPFPHH